MARKKKGQPVHGWVILDKPVGMTSTQAVGLVRRLFDAQKAGHAGTLDPLASGILPIALGEGTKTVPFAVDGDKVYRFRVQWGVETTTDDREGTATQTSAARPTRAQILALLPSFLGEIQQMPPQFSAIKVDGERAYDVARDGGTVALTARPVFIDEFELEADEGPDTATFSVLCGRGTYVRALARDMGRALGCFGHVIDLRRTRVGSFDESRAVTVDALKAAFASGEGMARFLEPVQAALDDLPGIAMSADDAGRIQRGQQVLIRGRDAPILKGEAYATCRGQVIAIGELAKGAFVPTRVFNLD